MFNMSPQKYTFFPLFQMFHLNFLQQNDLLYLQTTTSQFYKHMDKRPKHICQCKAVTLSEIKKSITKSGARTLLDIQNLTKASTGCGRCKLQVEEILGKELVKINALGNQLRIEF